MKKLFLLTLMLMMLFAGCSNGENIKTSNSPEPKGYTFEAKGEIIEMHAKVEPILKTLGTEMDYFEADSCAFQGIEKIYTYSGFELHTYELDKTDYVASVIFLDDSISTKEGISLGASLKDVTAAYGDKYTENLGVYSYEQDKMKLNFMIENDEVVSIEYIALNEDAK